MSYLLAARKKATREANNVEIVADDPLAAELALDEELAGYDFSLLKEEDGMKVDPSTPEDNDEWLIGSDEILNELSDEFLNDTNTELKSLCYGPLELNALTQSLDSCIDEALESHDDAFSLHRLVQGQPPQLKKRRVDDRRLKGTVCVILFLQSKFKAAFL